MLFFRSFKRCTLIGVALLGLSVSAANAAILEVSGGQLLGADGVNVGGALYDVRFLDGSCVSEFDGCDEAVDFTFGTAIEAANASQALIDQVFLDTGLGTFDTNPELTYGCGILELCVVITPYTTFFASALGQAVENYIVNGNDQVVNESRLVGTDFSNDGETVYAKWSPAVSAVPVPAAVWLFGTALVGLFGFGKRRITA